MEQDILKMIEQLNITVKEIKKTILDSNKKISKMYNKITEQETNSKDKNQEKTKELIDPDIYINKYESLKLNDYTKIVLRDFESRISILEEENQNYRKL